MPIARARSSSSPCGPRTCVPRLHWSFLAGEAAAASSGPDVVELDGVDMLGSPRVGGG